MADESEPTAEENILLDWLTERLRALDTDARRTAMDVIEAAMDGRMSTDEGGAELRAVFDGRWIEVANRLQERDR